MRDALARVILRLHLKLICKQEKRIMATSVLETLSNEFAAAASSAGAAVAAIYGRRWMPSSGIQWQKGVFVTADHTIRREEDIPVFVEEGKPLKAKLAGRDPSTDLAILKIAEDGATPIPQFGDSSTLKIGHFVLALGRSRGSKLVASAGIVGGLAGEWEPRRGGRLDQHIRLDLELYPGFSGGPLVNTQGNVIGINTRGLARGRAVTIPLATVNRVVIELLEKGHIARPYLGLAMQPVALPEALRGQLATPRNSALLVMHVEPSSPAEKAGILLGDLLTDVQGSALEDTADIQHLLGSFKVGDAAQASLLRAGTPLKVSVTLADRPAR
jgi:S1-C subfamily serine protease